MSGPALIAVDDDADALLEIEQTLRDRYGRHYRVECSRSPLEAPTAPRGARRPRTKTSPSCWPGNGSTA